MDGGDTAMYRLYRSDLDRRVDFARWARTGGRRGVTLRATFRVPRVEVEWTRSHGLQYPNAQVALGQPSSYTRLLMLDQSLIQQVAGPATCSMLTTLPL
jgi:hypothetical protein